MPGCSCWLLLLLILTDYVIGWASCVHQWEQLIMLMNFISWFAMNGVMDAKLGPPTHKLQVLVNNATWWSTNTEGKTHMD